MAKRTRPARRTAPKPSKLETDFLLLWRFYNGPNLVRELRFHPGRQWRADFAHPQAKVLIEIEGAVWTNGRHTRGSGFLADCEKYNSAALAGWTVFRLADRLISREWVERIIAFIAQRTGA